LRRQPIAANGSNRGAFNLPIVPFECALGDGPAVSLPAATIVAISPGDDTVDANRVIITGSGTINSFGVACQGQLDSEGRPLTVSKRVQFTPDAGQTITLHHNPPGLVLLGGIDRAIAAKAFGEYQSDASGNWTEISYSQSTVAPSKGGGSLVGLVYYLTSQTITIPTDGTRAWVRMWGATGSAGAGDAGSSTASYASAAGGYLEKLLTSLTPGNTLVFTRGNGGDLASSPNATVTTLASGTQTIGTLTCNGSKRALVTDTSTLLGGTATGGDLNVRGQSSALTVVGAVGAGGVNGPSHGADGSFYSGNPGNPGGMVIAWFSDYRT
jgi:hypothetical protein